MSALINFYNPLIPLKALRFLQWGASDLSDPHSCSPSGNLQWI